MKGGVFIHQSRILTMNKLLAALSIAAFAATGAFAADVKKEEKKAAAPAAAASKADVKAAAPAAPAASKK